MKAKPKAQKKRKKVSTVAGGASHSPQTTVPAAILAPKATKSVGPRKEKYDSGEIIAYLAAHHPGCPKKVRKQIGQIATEGRWVGLTLDAMVQKCADHYVVTFVCGVHRLVECGLAAAVANRMIEPQRKAVMTLWGF